MAVLLIPAVCTQCPFCHTCFKPESVSSYPSEWHMPTRIGSGATCSTFSLLCLGSWSIRLSISFCFSDNCLIFTHLPRLYSSTTIPLPPGNVFLQNRLCKISLDHPIRIDFSYGHNLNALCLYLE